MFELCATQNNDRRLSGKQKELIVQFAETERHNSDTKVNGLTDRGKNTRDKKCLLYFGHQKVREKMTQENSKAFSEK